MQREIPSLKVTVLKEISKKPLKCMTEQSLSRAFRICSVEFDLAQTLIDYITEAGRLTDDVLPPSLFENGRISLSLKNTKVSGKYILKIIDRIGLDLLALDVGGTFQVDDTAVASIMKKCRKLNSLNIRNCRKITDKSLDIIISDNNSLCNIDLGGNTNISSEGIIRFLNNRKISNLIELNLSGLPIRNDALSIISENAIQLTSLGIGYSEIGTFDCHILFYITML